MEQLAIGSVQRPKPGNIICGDSWDLFKTTYGRLLIVADGLGSGEPANRASAAAVRCARDHRDEGLGSVMDACNSACSATRGAAVGLVSIEPEIHRVAFAGVGNIEVRCRRNWPFHPISYRGIVGNGNYRSPRICEAEYEPGEMILVYSDGLSSRFDFEMELARLGCGNPVGADVQTLAQELGDRFSRGNDDITLIVLQLP